MVARGETPYVVMQRDFGKRDGIILLAPSGAATELIPDSINRMGNYPGADRVAPLAISASGNFLALGNADSVGVYDVGATRWAWVAAADEEFAFIDEPKADGLAVVSIRRGQCNYTTNRCESSYIVRTLLRDGTKQDAGLPVTIETRRQLVRYGDGIAVVSLAGGADNIALINVRTLSIVYRGPRGAAPPPVHRGAMCGDPQPSFYRFQGTPLHFVFEAGSFDLPLTDEGTSCAVSSDQKTLLVVAPPYLHFYTLRTRQ